MSMRSEQSARQLEHDADETRRRLSATLDSLADNLTPGRILDEVISYSRGGGASFLKGLGNAASTNPLPTLLIGVGAAMFLSGKGRMDSIPRSFGDLFNRSNGHGGDRDRSSENAVTKRSGREASVGHDENPIATVTKSAASGVKAAASSVRDAVSDTAERIGGGVSKAVSAVKDSAVGFGEDIGGFAEKTLDAAGTEASQLGDQAWRLTQDARGRATKFAEEQPLIMAAAGIAFGALVAALLPRTKIEDELMGEASDTIKDAAGEVVSERIENVSVEAGKVAEEIKATVAEHGLTAKAAVDAVRDAGERVSQAVGGRDETAAAGAFSGPS